MSNTYCIPAKPTFGKLKSQLYAGDYIKNKAITTILQNKKTQFIPNNICNTNNDCCNCFCIFYYFLLDVF